MLIVTYDVCTSPLLRSLKKSLTCSAVKCIIKPLLMLKPQSIKELNTIPKCCNMLFFSKIKVLQIYTKLH